MAQSLITLQVELEELETPITRELQVDGALTLGELHDALQIVFGWREQHLHLFRDSSPNWARDRLETDRWWGDTEQLDLKGLLSEYDITIGEAVADGSIWYEYDFGDGWIHRITASAPTRAIGEVRPVTLVGGQGRGPFEDSGGPWGYTEKLTILADERNIDHGWIAEWVAEVIGPWFPPTPETFEIDSIQAELDSYFGFHADERDPHDMSGLVVADDLRGPGDLSPDALLVDFASIVPASLRSEFRQHVRRTSLLAPIETPPEVREQLVAPFAWLLNAIGDTGIKLSAAGWLPPAVVIDGVETLGWRDPHTKSTREDTTVSIRMLREATMRLGLARLINGRLIRTGHGNSAASSTDELWGALTSRLLVQLSPGAQVAGAAYLLTLVEPADAATDAAGTRRPDKWRDVAFALHVCGWAPSRDPDGFFERQEVADIVAPVRAVVSSLGSTVGATGHTKNLGRPLETDPHLALFARAALRGPAGIRSSGTTPYR